MVFLELVSVLDSYKMTIYKCSGFKQTGVNSNSYDGGQVKSCYFYSSQAEFLLFCRLVLLSGKEKVLEGSVDRKGLTLTNSRGKFFNCRTFTYFRRIHFV